MNRVGVKSRCIRYGCMIFLRINYEGLQRALQGIYRINGVENAPIGNFTKSRYSLQVNA